MKLSELMKLYDFDLFKDTNGNFYMHDNRDVIERFKQYKSVGNTVLNVVDAIPEGLIDDELHDIENGYISKKLVNKCFDKGYNLDDIESAIAFLEYAKTISDERIDSKLDLLKAIYNCDFEDDYKEGFITRDIYEEYPKFGFAFDYIGQGYGYKANYNCKWEEIPEKAIMYIPEHAIETDEETGIEFATEVYTKESLENLIKQYKMTDDHFITAEGLLEALTWEYPETYLEGCDFDIEEVTEITCKNENVSKITKEPKETKNKNTNQKEK